MRLKTFSIFFMMVVFGTASVLAQGGVRKRDYNRILNEYCNAYFADCFGGQSYVDHSLSVLKVTPDGSNQTLIGGRFSYIDYEGRKHRAVSFQSVIETMGSEVQRITFRVERPADMTHTRSYWDGCSKLFGQREQEAAAWETRRQEVRYYTTLLNDFCERNYSNCFSGRHYQANSIVVKQVETDDYTGNVTVQGTHTYVGRTGTTYREYKFVAKIRYTGSAIRIEFNKESAADLMHSSSYWETCTKNY